MEIQLIGDHQVNNAVLARTVLKAIRDKRGVELSNEAIKKDSMILNGQEESKK